MKTRTVPLGTLALSLLAACGQTTTGGDTQTNWLRECGASAECGSLACLCGHCVEPCDSGACTTPGTTCQATTSPAAQALCGAPAAAVCLAQCDASRACAIGQRCVGGACVPAASTTDAGGASDAFAQSDSGGSGGTDAGTFVPVNAQSCAGGPPCNGVSCCTSIDVPGGTFPQGRSTVVGASDYYPDPNGYWSEETPEFPSTVSSFALDEYAVTVGRFRKFVEAYVSNTASAPAAGAGANPNVPGAGWQSEWNTNLPASQAAFKDLAHLNSCGGAPYYQTWTDNVGANENKPINCVSWYEAFAFCIWDGGRLPTESEWEYAAAGGEENRLYPWGSATPDCTYVNYCSGGNVPVANVGSTPNGNGRWGHADLAGNGMEWTLDWYDIYPNSPVTNYAAISNGHAIASSFARSVRAGDFRATFRDGYTPDSRYAVSMRCARATQ